MAVHKGYQDLGVIGRAVKEDLYLANQGAVHVKSTKDDSDANISSAMHGCYEESKDDTKDLCHGDSRRVYKCTPIIPDINICSVSSETLSGLDSSMQTKVIDRTHLFVDYHRGLGKRRTSKTVSQCGLSEINFRYDYVLSKTLAVILSNLTVLSRA